MSKAATSPIRPVDRRSTKLRSSGASAIRRFLLHVLPDGFHRIRHYGLFATGQCKGNVARVRSLLAPAQAPTAAEPEPASDAGTAAPACPCCGGRLVIIERFRRGETPRARPTAIRIDTS